RGGLAPCEACSIVDRGLGGGPSFVGQVGRDRGGPAVSEATGCREKARPLGAEPDTDGMRWRRAACRAVEPVVAAVEVDGAIAAPECANDSHCLFEGVDRLCTRQWRNAEGLDRFPVAARAEAELEAAAAQQIKRSRSLRE